MNEKLDEALKSVGFVVCEFGPDDEECEVCDASNVQLYYRRTSHEYEEGQYYCADCVIEEHVANQTALKEIEDKEKLGHTYHCSCRLVWGDGECECGSDTPQEGNKT